MGLKNQYSTRKAEQWRLQQTTAFISITGLTGEVDMREYPERVI